MREITKENLPTLVHQALNSADIGTEVVPDLALKILQSGAIEFTKRVVPPRDTMELIVIGGRSSSAVRAGGNQVNVFALAGAILGAASAAGVATLACPILIGVLCACSKNLSPKEAAFFVATERLNDNGVIPTAAAIAAVCTNILPGLPISSGEILDVADDLLKMGVPVSIGPPPNSVIHHKEWTITVPGF